MGTQPFTVWNNQVILASNYTIVPNQEITLLSSLPISNSSGTIYNSFKLVVDYSNLQPNSGQFFIGLLVEAKDTLGNWGPIAYQFSPIRNTSQAQQRVIILQPNIDTFNTGIDDIVYPVDSEVARVSRQQGFLPETEFRICLSLKDKDPLGVNAFNQITVSATGELYNV